MDPIFHFLPGFSLAASRACPSAMPGVVNNPPHRWGDIFPLPPWSNPPSVEEQWASVSIPSAKGWALSGAGGRVAGAVVERGQWEAT